MIEPSPSLFQHVGMQFIGLLHTVFETLKTFYYPRLRFITGDTGTHHRIFSLSEMGWPFYAWEEAIFSLVQNSFFIQFIFTGHLEFIRPTNVFCQV